MSTDQDKAKRRAILHMDSVHEISLVDFGANGETYLVVKQKSSTGTSVAEAPDGTLTIVPDQRLDLPDAVAKALTEVGKVLGALVKALDVNAVAADEAFTVLMDIFDRSDTLMGLIMNMPGTMAEGTLDTSIATELAAMAGSMLNLATMFGGSGQPVMMRAPILDELQVQRGQFKICPLVVEGGELTSDSLTRLEDVLVGVFEEKAGAKMSTTNLDKLHSISERLVAFVTSMRPPVEGVDKSLDARVAELTQLLGEMAENQEHATDQIVLMGKQISVIAKRRGIILPTSAGLPHNDLPDNAHGDGDGNHA